MNSPYANRDIQTYIAASLALRNLRSIAEGACRRHLSSQDLCKSICAEGYNNGRHICTCYEGSICFSAIAGWRRKSWHLLFLLFLSFAISLLFVIASSAWFTRRLEAICDLLGLPIGVLSMLSALGANVPNYAASIVAIARGQLDVGLGIIIGSNIYNVAIILGISILTSSEASGIVLRLKETRDVRIIANYALSIVFTTSLAMWVLPGSPLGIASYNIAFASLLLIIIAILALAIFSALVWHVFNRPHHPHNQTPVESSASASKRSSLLLLRWSGEVVLALFIALGGVVVMVQSGQDLTLALHIPQVLTGLVVLAVATSLPNTVVAVSLARTGRAAACVEEVFSSNSINAALGILLPLIIWHQMVHDHLLLILDVPLMIVLTLAALLAVLIGRLHRPLGALLLLIYVLWVVAHLWL
jgi:cation:H+ antiporter